MTSTASHHYLLTGAAGFIGFRVAELLLAQGHTVTGIDNLNDAYDIRLKEWRLRSLRGQPRFTFVQLDIMDRAGLASLFTRPPDAVVNLAARAGVRPSVANPWLYYETNVTGTLNLLDLCRATGVKKFILASTSSVYGDGNPMPLHEDGETSRPISPYAASKKAAEVLAHTYHKLYDIDITVPRYFTVYGPAGRPDMSLFRFTQCIAEGRPITVFGDGTQSRDFTFVEDVARGTVAALKPLGYEIINLGSDRPVTVNAAVALIEGLLGKKALVRHEPRHPADVPATWADISKARRLLGWQPATSFEDGVEALVRWYLDNRDWARQVKTY